MPNPKSPARAILTDSHLWLPIIVLFIGIATLVLVK